MNPSTSDRVEKHIVKSMDLMLSLFDFASPANVPGEYGRALRHGKNLAGGGHMIHRGLVQYRMSGDLLAWLIIFDGVFKIEVRILADSKSLDFCGSRENEFLGGSQAPRRLQCSTGRLVLASPYLLGSESLEPIVIVAPGTYQVALDWILREEQKHWHLEMPCDYPVGEGPDGILYIARVSDQDHESHGAGR